MSVYLGLINELAGLSKVQRSLVVYDDAIVLSHLSTKDALKMAAFGVTLGKGAGRSFGKKKARETGPAADPSGLAAAHPDNQIFPMSEITGASFSNAKLGLYRQLSLRMRSGEVHSFQWQPGNNRDKHTKPLLREALGSRLD